MPLRTAPAAQMVEASSDVSDPTLDLTPLEDALCEMLVDACDWMEEHHPQPDAVESAGVSVTYSKDWTCDPRMAGGWVRDKLLGIESHDMDVALSSLTGHVFALLLRQYLLSEHFARSSVATRTSSPLSLQSAAITSDKSSAGQLVSHITKIAANPAQSKNLETATAKLAGLQLDFVNLRKEMYAGATRIPKMEFGTAFEDAQRRDITINALFYNLRTRRVEDLTEMGLEDMRARKIRTPLEPKQTFLDDPLRVLRCVRFASRFGYTVDEDIFACLTGSDGEAIREALRTKVSRERFGQEIDKMMAGPSPSAAIALIEQMGMFDVCFAPPPQYKVRPINAGGQDISYLSTVAVNRALSILNVCRAEAALGKQDDLPSTFPFLRTPTGDSLLIHPIAQRLLYYSATLLPLRDAEVEWKKGRWRWAGACVASQGLKISDATGQEPLTALQTSASMLRRPTQGWYDADNAGEYRGGDIPCLDAYRVSSRALRALLLRHPYAHAPLIGVTPELRLLWAMVADLSTEDSLWSSAEPAEPEARTALGSPIAASYVSLYAQLQQEGVLDRIDERPLLNGLEVKDLLQIKPGLIMQVIMKRVEVWQFDRDLRHADVQDAKAQCKEWLKREWTEGKIALPENGAAR